jgi:hypothetical protein
VHPKKSITLSSDHSGPAFFKADPKRVMVQMGNVLFSGDYPAYRLTANIQDINFDLAFKAETKDLRLGRDKILFGDKKDRYWSLTVLAPQASVSGKIICKGKTILLRPVIR